MPTLQRSIVALLLATAAVDEPRDRVSDSDRISVLSAGDRKTSIEAITALSPHEVDQRIPKRFTTTLVLVALGHRQSDGIAEDVQTSPSSRKRNNQAVSIVKEANIQIAVTAN